MTVTKSGKGQVQVRHYKSLEESPFDAKLWPNGQDFIHIFSEEGITPKQPGDQAFWQAAFRWCLLKKYGLCPDHLQNPYIINEEASHRTLSFSPKDIDAINKVWQGHCTSAATKSLPEDDLSDFLATGRSNERPLQWSILDCGPGCQFKLHGHPNLEIAYCLQGTLHEIRMAGSPLTKSFEKDSTSSDSNRLLGPNLSTLQRSWNFGTLAEGEWLVNELGSIHKSFTATNGNGCVLLVLWSGSHADVPAGQEPTSVNVQEALETMDRALCDCKDNWTTISETFLPESETSQQ